MRSVWMMTIAATLLAGCFESTTTRPDGAPPPGDARVPPPPPEPTRDVDLLFVIDDSGSMGEEQASLAIAISPMVRALTSGDIDGDGARDTTPVESLHVGVVTTDMGVGGFTVPTCDRADFGDDGILQSRGPTDMTGCMATYPSFLAYEASPGADTDEFANDLACVMNVGTGGCGFEQQLEAMLKAVSPSAPTSWTALGYEPPMFFRNTRGHGDGANAGFLRDDSVLAVVILSDEEDCSAVDPDLYNPPSPTYGATDLNLRCWAHGDVALHPIARYVDGLVQLRRHPSRVVYSVIAGVPTDLATSETGATDWDALIGSPDVRDDRMIERVDPTMSNRLLPSCNVPGRGVAFPPVRMVRLGRELQARGAGVTIQSICQDSFAQPVAAIVGAIGERLE